MAFFTARCKDFSSRWYLLIVPVRGSPERWRAGQTYCHPHSRQAEPGTVQEHGHDPVDAIQVYQHGLTFLPGEHDR
jgi:hypothetical protein